MNFKFKPGLFHQKSVEKSEFWISAKFFKIMSVVVRTKTKVIWVDGGRIDHINCKLQVTNLGMQLLAARWTESVLPNTEINGRVEDWTKAHRALKISFHLLVPCRKVTSVSCCSGHCVRILFACVCTLKGKRKNLVLHSTLSVSLDYLEHSIW